MSGRTTAEIVADLRAACFYHCVEHSMVGRCRNCMAADRLTELDAQLAAVNAALDQYDRADYEHAELACVSAIAKAVRP